MNRTDETLELVYAETWRLNREYQDYELKLRGADRSRVPVLRQLSAVAANEYTGALKALAAVLLVRGEIGRRTFPARPSEAFGDRQQAVVLLSRWAVARGHVTQQEVDRMISLHPQMQEALEYLGRDRGGSGAGDTLAARG